MTGPVFPRATSDWFLGCILFIPYTVTGVSERKQWEVSWFSGGFSASLPCVLGTVLSVRPRTILHQGVRWGREGFLREGGFCRETKLSLQSFGPQQNSVTQRLGDTNLIDSSLLGNIPTLHGLSFAGDNFVQLLVAVRVKHGKVLQECLMAHCVRLHTIIIFQEAGLGFIRASALGCCWSGFFHLWNGETG